MPSISSKHQELHLSFVSKFTDFFKSYGSDHKTNVENLDVRSSEVGENCLNNVSKSGAKELSRTSILRLFRIPKIPKDQTGQKKQKEQNLPKTTSTTPTIIEKIPSPIVTAVQQNIPPADQKALSTLNENKMHSSYVTEPNWNGSDKTPQQTILPVDLSQYAMQLTSSRENVLFASSFENNSDPAPDNNFLPPKQVVPSYSITNLQSNNTSSFDSNIYNNNSV